MLVLMDQVQQTDSSQSRGIKEISPLASTNATAAAAFTLIIALNWPK